MKRIAVFCSILVCMMLFAVPGSAGGDDYIKDYSVSIKVAADRTFDVSETVKYSFASGRSVISRTILLQGAAPDVLETGKVANVAVPYTCSVSDVKVKGSAYTAGTVTEGGNTYCRIDIGDAGKPLKGTKTFAINYKLHFSEDSEPSFDKLLYDLAGNWDCRVEILGYNVEMPDDFSSDRLFVTKFTGKKAKNYKYVEYRNAVSSYIYDVEPGEKVILSAALPEEYFHEAAPVDTSSPAKPAPSLSVASPVRSPVAAVAQTVYGKASPGLVALYGVIALTGIILAIVLPLRAKAKKKRAALAQSSAQAGVEVPTYDVVCPNCGASNKVPGGTAGKCEYCKSALPGPG